MRPARSASPRISGPMQPTGRKFAVDTGPAAAEKQRHGAEALAAGIDGKRPELITQRLGQRAQEESVMVTGHPDALADFGFVRLLIF